MSASPGHPQPHQGVLGEDDDARRDAFVEIRLERGDDALEDDPLVAGRAERDLDRLAEVEVRAVEVEQLLVGPCPRPDRKELRG
jgi:hypothetical protein